MTALRIRVPQRRVLVEVAVVVVTAGAVLLGVPPFGWSVPAALVACALLRCGTSGRRWG